MAGSAAAKERAGGAGGVACEWGDRGRELDVGIDARDCNGFERKDRTLDVLARSQETEAVFVARGGMTVEKNDRYWFFIVEMSLFF